MSISIHRRRDLQPSQVSELNSALAAYYTNPPASYYATANNAAAHYTPEVQPFHCDLVSRVQPGMDFLELGCGTAHLCQHVEARGAHYTGLDYSAGLLAENRRRFQRARFMPIDTDLADRFDFVASLYTIEHVADPPAYLDRLWGFCKPGGFVAIICPEFVDCECQPPSLFYGQTPRRLRKKLFTFAFEDAWAHFCDLKWNAMRWQGQARTEGPGAFWINLLPRVLHGAEYTIDADAVHFPRLKDLVWWFQQRGANIVMTSGTLPRIPAEILRFNCYVLLQKP